MFLIKKKIEKILILPPQNRICQDTTKLKERFLRFFLVKMYKDTL